MPRLTFDDMFSIACGLAAFIVIVMFWTATVARRPIEGRLNGLSDRRARLKSQALTKGNRSRRVVSVGMMRTLAQRLDLFRNLTNEKTGIRLTRAGFRSKDAVVLFLFMKLCMPMVFGLVAVTFIFVMPPFELPQSMRMPIAAGAVMLGFMAPDLYLRNATDKRRKALNKALPESLDLLTICVEAGLSIDMALTRVSREVMKSSVDLAFELSLTAIELTYLPDRQQAFENFADRTDIPGVRALVNTMRQTEKYGTPLSQSLRVLSAEFRHERLMKAEEKGARLPAMMTVPMMVFILPTLFLVILGPGILGVLDAMGDGS